MSARIIQRVIIQELYARSFVVPNYTPVKWWECDVFEVTYAGFFREYEVKVTMKDFRADLAKCDNATARRRHARRGADVSWLGQTEHKHKILAARDARGPVQFWFVVPDKIAGDARLELPAHAGLMVVSDRRLSTAVEAPRLHNVKADPSLVAHARNTCYWRMVRLFLKEEQS